MGMTMKKTMLGAALVAGLFATGAAAANAEPRGFHGRGFDRPVVRGGYAGSDFTRHVDRYRGGFGIAVGAPVVDTYIPPCPGDGYVWTAGYYNAGVWVPGAWGFRGRVGFDRGFAGGYRDNHVAYDRGFHDRGLHGRR